MCIRDSSKRGTYILGIFSSVTDSGYPVPERTVKRTSVRHVLVAGSSKSKQAGQAKNSSRQYSKELTHVRLSFLRVAYPGTVASPFVVRKSTKAQSRAASSCSFTLSLCILLRCFQRYRRRSQHVVRPRPRWSVCRPGCTALSDQFRAP